eukprot:g47546.t1
MQEDLLLHHFGIAFPTLGSISKRQIPDPGHQPLPRSRPLADQQIPNPGPQLLPQTRPVADHQSPDLGPNEAAMPSLPLLPCPSSLQMV